MKQLAHFLQKQLDACIYAFIGPFAMLYVFPQFFLGLEEKFLCRLSVPSVLDIIGSLLMISGGILASWCAILMFLHSRSSPNPFSKPKGILTKGPYGIVRHPMMWAIHIVLIGELLTWLSPMLLAWFVMWLRFSILYIDRYEEPYLLAHFGEDYKVYCRSTPRWIPSFKRTTETEKDFENNQ